MSENQVDFVSYTKDHNSIVRSGISAISDVLNSTNISEKRSLLLCLDKYLDPYYGYNLPYYDDIIILLQEQLFLNDDRRVKEDILDLLCSYCNDLLDYLADKIEELESDPELLKDALYALSNTCNDKYVHIFKRYESYHDPYIRDVAIEILTEISESNTTI